MSRRNFWSGCGLAIALALTAVPAAAQLTVSNEDVRFRFGALGQFWGDWTQDPATSGYSQNLYIRRARLIVSGEIGKNLTFFFETDAPNMGKTPKALGSGFLVQDAFLEYKVNNAFRVDGGLMLVPFSRNGLQSPASYSTLDISPLATVANAPTQSSVLRDAGFAASGFFLADHLQYRIGAFQGQRDPNARNSLRSAGYLQYDFFDTETTYTFAGTALGKKKILAVDCGFDKQGAYRGYSANVAAAKPVHGGDEIGGQFQFLTYDGRNKFPVISHQNDYVAEATYYVHRARVQPFGKFESQNFVEAAARNKDINRYGTGVNYYIRGQNLKWTLQYLRALPRNSATAPSNEVTMQLQFFYF
ncbi:MAG TPA: porin [Bryobacteraceae bacterium]|nr:porin [Bryobacteraceae bacterium]